MPQLHKNVSPIERISFVEQFFVTVHDFLIGYIVTCDISRINRRNFYIGRLNQLQEVMENGVWQRAMIS